MIAEKGYIQRRPLFQAAILVTLWNEAEVAKFCAKWGINIVEEACDTIFSRGVPSPAEPELMYHTRRKFGLWLALGFDGVIDMVEDETSLFSCELVACAPTPEPIQE